ncbi:semaphorin-7A [Poeciliopsis prolifica]|uniref:semaphorin-7A n=1 Tax=Poeciliopsis prolifica TaxID=188132 RepID=UPI002413524A|nr:semaphorin-7A [Poeciliopsis prolifica]
MKHCVHIYLCFAVHFKMVLSKDAPALGSKNSPRLLKPGIFSDQYKYDVNQNHSVFSYREEEQELYVGGTDFIIKFNASNYRVIEKFPITTTGQHKCSDGQCKNVITIIEKFGGYTFACGTNGHKPKCWKLSPSVKNQTYESYEGAGISPLVYTHNCLSLTVDGDLYAAAPLDIEGSSLQFRRKAGNRTNVWMYDSWLSEPTFISASWVKRWEDPDNEKIYIFFREKNSDHSPDADPWISRVARVCKTDEGGSKRFFQNMWTSFLKARLVCGFSDESLYFNRLQDIYVMHADDWHQTRVYALFTSSWNSTAVCIYSIEMIEKIFENSTFKGYANEIPTPRPGTCVSNSKNLPRATVNVVKDHPEMVDWVHSFQSKAPFYVSNYNYTKIVVDRVQGADQQVYNVLLLATDTGKIHKVLEAGSEPFIILETQISKNSSIQAMTLNSQKKKLVVGFSDKISTVDLQKCEEYNTSCADCVLARDPYCAWTTSGCSPSSLGGIQNIKDGHTSVCSQNKAANVLGVLTRSKRQIYSPKISGTVHSVPEGVPFYLSCPIESYHAKYTWKHGSNNRPCLQMLSNCLHLIPSMGPENYGEYECISTEKDYNKTLKKYHLKQQHENQDSRFADSKLNDAPILAPQLLFILLQTSVLWEILR